VRTIARKAGGSDPAPGGCSPNDQLRLGIAARAARAKRRGDAGLVAEDGIEYGDPRQKRYQQVRTFRVRIFHRGRRLFGDLRDPRLRRMPQRFCAGRADPEPEGPARSQVNRRDDEWGGRRRRLMEDLRDRSAPGASSSTTTAWRSLRSCPVHADIPPAGKSCFLDETDPLSFANERPKGRRRPRHLRRRRCWWAQRGSTKTRPACAWPWDYSNHAGTKLLDSECRRLT